MNNNISIKNIINLIENEKETKNILSILLNIKNIDELLIILSIPNSVISIFKYLKYYEHPLFYLQEVPNHIENISNIFPIIEREEKLDIIISYTWLYNISYLDFNKKDLLGRYNKIIAKKLPIISNNRCYQRKQRQKIKLGIVGFTINNDSDENENQDFSIHSVFKDRVEIIKRLDSNIFEKYLIVKKKHSNKYLYKGFGYLLRELYDNVDYIVSISDYNFCKINQLMDLDLDILMYPDIGMNAFTNIMANYRIAPIQINTWGHSITSGIKNIDYFISSKYYELEDLNIAQQYYSEKLISLNSLCTNYRKINLNDVPSINDLGLPDNKQILFCIQNIRKLNKDFYNLLKNIISQKPDIIILLGKYFLLDSNIDFINNITGSKNNIIFVDFCDTYRFFSYLYYSTLVLDTYPFGGCNTSIEALSIGKIVVTYPSKYLPGRFTYGLYKKMNILDPIVFNYEKYLEKVLYYLDNDVERENLEQKILEQNHLLFNDDDSVKEWQETLIKLSKSYVELIEEPEYKFASDWFSSSINNFENNLLPLKDNINKILEIGSYEGRSSVWFLNNIMNNEHSRLYCIDPFFATGNYKENFLHNINISYNNTKINIIENTALLGLSQLIVTKKQFNIIYINSSHYSKDVNQYLVLSWNLITINGLLILDDSLFTEVKENIDSKLLPQDTIEHFLSTISNQYEVIHKDYQLLIKKIYHKTQNDFLNDIGLKTQSLVEKLKYNNIELLQSLIPKNKPVAHCYYEESFNFGDSAIWYGQEHLLELLNIEPVYTCSDRNYNKLEIQTQLKNDGVILFRGGGNFGDLYVYHNLRLQIMQDNPNSIFIQLPQSVKFNNVENITKTANIIKKMKKVILLARDINTYQYFLQHFYFDNVEIYLCSDMAFNLSNINVNTKPIFKELILKRTDQETEYKIEDIIKNLLGTNIITISYIYKYQNNDLLETTIYTNEQKEIGITDWYLTKSLNDELYNTLDYHTKAKLGLEIACNILSLGEIVKTDRLHAFILSLQLNKPHTIINNNNGKLFSFYNTWCKNSTITQLDNNFGNTIIINKPIIENNTISCKILFGNKEIVIKNTYYHINYNTKLDNLNLYQGIEGFVSLFIPHMMFTGDKIITKMKISQIFYDNLLKLKEYYESLDIGNIYFNIDCETYKNTNEIIHTKNLTTFTGGVDSFYTLYSNLSNIDTLLYCINYDINKDLQPNLLKQQLDTIKNIAQILNKDYIICETNQRIELEKINYTNNKYNDIWGHFLHGCCLFSNFYNLSNHYNTFYMPSSHPKSSNYLWGSTFYIDHLYNSEFLNIIHDGDCNRVDKIKYLLNFKDVIFKYLKVCYQNPSQKYNCSKCEKCIRTFLPIGIINREYLKDLKTFNIEITQFDEIKNIYLNHKFTKNSDIDFQNEIKTIDNMCT